MAEHSSDGDLPDPTVGAGSAPVQSGDPAISATIASGPAVGSPRLWSLGRLLRGSSPRGDSQPRDASEGDSRRKAHRQLVSRYEAAYRRGFRLLDLSSAIETLAPSATVMAFGVSAVVTAGSDFWPGSRPGPGPALLVSASVAAIVRLLAWVSALGAGALGDSLLANLDTAMAQPRFLNEKDRQEVMQPPRDAHRLTHWAALVVGVLRILVICAIIATIGLILFFLFLLLSLTR